MNEYQDEYGNISNINDWLAPSIMESVLNAEKIRLTINDGFEVGLYKNIPQTHAQIYASFPAGFGDTIAYHFEYNFNPKTLNVERTQLYPEK